MLQQETLRFLRNLKKNNNKLWFDAHRDSYLAAKTDFEHLVQEVIGKFGRIDRSVTPLQAKDCVFRIYKDIRFSKDKTPYKTHFAAALGRGGKMAHLPGYYFHVSPGGKSYFGGGIWMPETEALAKIRQEIDYNFPEFRKIITTRNFRSYLGEMEDGDALSRPPKGYAADNPAIDWLRKKSFFAGCELNDHIICTPGLLKQMILIFSAIKPLVDFLHKALD
ncbi:MAG TPA: DUF2461 domain-containing protein [Chitinophagaceae bacterium]|nr:DUF2461 domain-containing protein [Chitinophagaceae bacterium]